MKNINKEKINNYVNKFTDYLKDNRKILIFCLITTIVWGLVTHSYIFFHSSFSHDSLNEFVADNWENVWRIQLGRVFVPIYRTLIRGAITTPWLIGILSLIYISIAVFLVTKIFNIKSKPLIILLSGMFTTNITVIATAATYIHDLDTNMLALALSILSVYLWKTFDKGFLYGIIPLSISIGLYQSYISVTITLILIYLIMRLLNNEKFFTIFKIGFKSITMIIGGGILYFISMKFICYITDISLVSGDYNSVDTVLTMSISEIISNIINGYKGSIYKILTVPSMYQKTTIFIIHAAMIIIPGISVLLKIIQKEIMLKEKILIIILIGLLPLGMNIVFPLTGGMSHDLMHYGIWMIYLFILLISWFTVKNNIFKNPIIKIGQQIVLIILISVILMGNIQTANAVYLKKDLEAQANLSLFTRIVYQMENHDGYITGKTPVVFVGKPEAVIDLIPGFERTYEITGSGNWYVLGAALRDFYQSYFDYILINPAIMADTQTWNNIQENVKVKTMPSYPEKGSITMIDNNLVIKLGNSDY